MLFLQLRSTSAICRLDCIAPGLNRKKQEGGSPLNIKDNVVDAIGNTPLIKLQGASEATGCTILGKAEFLNPGQSVKDRAARQMILEAEARGDLKPGGLIVEGTAGNTGIGLALVANARLTSDVWCGRRDLNPHGRSHQILNLACLPIPPRPLLDAHPISQRNQLSLAHCCMRLKLWYVAARHSTVQLIQMRSFNQT